MGKYHKVLQFVVSRVLDDFYPENLFRDISSFSSVFDSLEEKVLKWFVYL